MILLRLGLLLRLVRLRRILLRLVLVVVGQRILRRLGRWRIRLLVVVVVGLLLRILLRKLGLVVGSNRLLLRGMEVEVVGVVGVVGDLHLRIRMVVVVVVELHIRIHLLLRMGEGRQR